MTCLPKPRGPLGVAVLSTLADVPTREVPRIDIEPETSDDAALTLWVLHELAYRGFADVDDRAEGEAELARVRRRLEEQLESDLRARWPGVPEADLGTGFFDWVAAHDGPSLARHVQTLATEEQVLDLLRVRSIYHLKEADPTTWVIPRLPTAAKAALVELQYDEYGVGDPARLHAHLFARGLEASGLRPEHGAYVDEAPLEVLEQNNALSMFGLQRRLRGAAVGHLAAFEATSSLPSRRMAQGLERLGFPVEMVGYYAEHVEADAVHEQVALQGHLHVARGGGAGSGARRLVRRVGVPATSRTGRRTGFSRRGECRHERGPALPGWPDAAPRRARGHGRGRGGAPHDPSGVGRLPVRQVRCQAVVRRHPQGVAAEAQTLVTAWSTDWIGSPWPARPWWMAQMTAWDRLVTPIRLYAVRMFDLTVLMLR